MEKMKQFATKMTELKVALHNAGYDDRDETEVLFELIDKYIVELNELDSVERKNDIFGYDFVGNECFLDPKKMFCSRCLCEMEDNGEEVCVMSYEIPEDGTCPLCGREHNGTLFERVE